MAGAIDIGVRCCLDNAEEEAVALPSGGCTEESFDFDPLLPVGAGGGGGYVNCGAIGN